MTSRTRNGSGEHQPVVKDVTFPSFDPNPSGKFAAETLAGSKAKGALIGRLAVWTWVKDESEHAYTKDLDVAVSRSDLPRICEWLSQQGHEARELQIGGVNVMAPHGINVDFITRAGELADLAPLFEDAIRAAEERGHTVTIGGERLLVVPPEYVVAMKLGTFERRDEEDAQRLLEGSPVDVERLRQIVQRFMGPRDTERLEIFLRSSGHPAAHPRGKYNGKRS